MAQLGKPEFGPQNSHKKPGIVACDCTPTPGEMETPVYPWGVSLGPTNQPAWAK